MYFYIKESISKSIPKGYAKELLTGTKVLENGIVINTHMYSEDRFIRKLIFVGISTKTCTSSSITENCGYVANTHSNHQKEKNNSEAACIIIQAVFCLCQNA